MASPVGIQQLIPAQGFEWGDATGQRTMWFDSGGGALNTDAPFNMQQGFTVVPGNQIGTTAGIVALGSTTSTIRVPDNTTSINFLTILQNFGGTTNVPNGNSARGIYVENHWVDSTNSVATVAGIYAQVYNDSTATITDHIGLVGRAYVTSTGTSTHMDGVYGSVGFSGAGAVTNASALHAKDPPIMTAACVITNLIGVRVDGGTVSTILPVNHYGVWILSSPGGASGNNIGILVGPTPAGTNTAAVYIAPSSGTGLIVGTGGMVNLLSGIITSGAAPAPTANTASLAATLGLAAGSSAGANTALCALYYYRSTSTMAYCGFDSDTSVLSGHTKSVLDYVIAPNNVRSVLVDGSGNVWVKGTVASGGPMITNHVPQAINSTATATAAQAASGYITSTSAAPTTITLPTGTALGTQLGATQGTIHDLYIDNTAGASTVTIAVAVNGILSADAAANAGSIGLLTVPSGVTGQARFTLMFSSATAYTFSRTA